MYNNFLRHYDLALTPISPVHVGCNEDFGPFFLIRKKALYSFSLELVKLGYEKRRLFFDVARKIGGDELRDFLSKNFSDFRLGTRDLVPVDGGTSDAYASKNKKINIKRQIYIDSVDGQIKYLPGSTLKGAFATALADRLNRDGEKKQGNLQVLFGGDFEESPMRHLKVSDFMPGQGGLATGCYCTQTFHKVKPHKSCALPMTYVEAIAPAQYRQLRGQVDMTVDHGMTGSQLAYKEIRQVFRDLNEYSLRRWQRDVDFYREASYEWAISVEKLLKELKPRFDQGKCALIRIGMYAGAESKSLTDVALFDIRHHDGFVEENQKSTQAIRLATARVCDEKDLAVGVPFGWCICELVGADNNNALDRWCSQMISDIQRAYLELDAERTAIASDLLDRIENDRKNKEQQIKDLEQQQRARDREEMHKAELAAMSPQRRKATEFADQLEKRTGALMVNDQLFAKVKSFLTKEVAEDTSLTAADKKWIADILWEKIKSRKMFEAGKAGKDLKNKLKEYKGE